VGRFLRAETGRLNIVSACILSRSLHLPRNQWVNGRSPAAPNASAIA
jgi:hypothetical protein